MKNFKLIFLLFYVLLFSCSTPYENQADRIKRMGVREAIKSSKNSMFKTHFEYYKDGTIHYFRMISDKSQYYVKYLDNVEIEYMQMQDSNTIIDKYIYKPVSKNKWVGEIIYNDTVNGKAEVYLMKEKIIINYFLNDSINNSKTVIKFNTYGDIISEYNIGCNGDTLGYSTRTYSKSGLLLKRENIINNSVRFITNYFYNKDGSIKFYEDRVLNTETNEVEDIDTLYAEYIYW